MENKEGIIMQNALPTDGTTFVHSEDGEDAPTIGQVIDMGSSVKWASCNVGADSPELPGLHLAWDEFASLRY